MYWCNSRSLHDEKTTLNWVRQSSSHEGVLRVWDFGGGGYTLPALIFPFRLSISVSCVQNHCRDEVYLHGEPLISQFNLTALLFWLLVTKPSNDTCFQPLVTSVTRLVVSQWTFIYIIYIHGHSNLKYASIFRFNLQKLDMLPHATHWLYHKIYSVSFNLNYLFSFVKPNFTYINFKHL